MHFRASLFSDYLDQKDSAPRRIAGAGRRVAGSSAAIFDAGANRFRCPPGTRRGGTFTDRFGTNCGYRLAETVVDSITKLQAAVHNATRRRGRILPKRPQKRSSALPDDYKNNLDNALNALLDSAKNLDDVAGQYETRGMIGRSVGELSQLAGMSDDDRGVLRGDTFFEDLNNLQRLIGMPDFENIDDATYSKIVDAIERSMKAEAGRLSLTDGEARDNGKVQRQIENINGGLLNALNPRRRDTRLPTPRDIANVDETLPDAPPPRLPSVNEGQVLDVVPPPPSVDVDFEVVDGTRRYTRRSLNNTQSLRRRKFSVRKRNGELVERKRKPKKLSSLSIHSSDRNELDNRIKREHTELKNFWIDRLLPERGRVDNVGRPLPRNYGDSEITEEDILDYLAISADGSDAHRLNMSRYKDFVELSSLVKYIDERNAGLYDDNESRGDFLDAHMPGGPFVGRNDELRHYADHIGRLNTNRKRSIALNEDGSLPRDDIASDFEMEVDAPELREPLPPPPPPLNPLADSIPEEAPTPPPPRISFSLTPSMGDDERQLPRDDGGVPFTPEFERILDLYDQTFKMNQTDRNNYMEILADETDDATLLELGHAIDSRELDVVLSAGQDSQIGLAERYPEIAKAHVFLEELKQWKMINKAAIFSDPQGRPWSKPEKELLYYIANAEADGYTVEEAIGNLANVQRIPELDKSGIQLLEEAERDFAKRLKTLDNPSEQVQSLSAVLTTNTELADIFTNTQIEETVQFLGARSDFGVPFSPALQSIYGKIDEIDAELKNTNTSTGRALEALSDDELVGLYVESLNRIEALTSGEGFDIDDVDRSEYLGLLNEFQFIMALEPNERDYGRLSEIGGEIQQVVDNFTEADREILKNKYKFIRSDLGERTDREVGDIATVNLDRAIKRELDRRQRKQDDIDIERLLGIGGGSTQRSSERGYENFSEEPIARPSLADIEGVPFEDQPLMVDQVEAAIEDLPNPVVHIDNVDDDTDFSNARNPLYPVISHFVEEVASNLQDDLDLSRIASMPEGAEKTAAILQAADERRLQDEVGFEYLFRDALQFTIDDVKQRINPSEYPRLHRMKQKIDSLEFDSDERERREEILESLIRQTVLAELASFVDGDADQIRGDGYHNRSEYTLRSEERMRSLIQDAFEFGTTTNGVVDREGPGEADVLKAVGRQILDNFFIEGNQLRDFRTDFSGEVNRGYPSIGAPAVLSQHRQRDSRVLNTSILALDPELLNEIRRVVAPEVDGDDLNTREGIVFRNQWREVISPSTSFEVTWEDAGFSEAEAAELVDNLPSTFLTDSPEDFLLDFLERYSTDQDSLQKMIDGDFSEVERDIGSENFYQVANVLARVIDSNHTKLVRNREDRLNSLARSTDERIFQRWNDTDGTNRIGERALLRANPTFTGESRYDNLLTKLGVTLYNTALEGPEQDSALKEKMGLLLGHRSDTDTPLDAIEQANSNIAEFTSLTSRIDSLTALKATRAIFGGEKDVYPYENTPDIQPSDIADKLANSDLTFEELDNFIDFLIDKDQSNSWQDDLLRWAEAEVTPVANIDTLSKIDQKILAGALLARYRKENSLSERIREQLDTGSVPYRQTLLESLRPFELNVPFSSLSGESGNFAENKEKLLDLVLGGRDSLVDRLLSTPNVTIDNPTVQARIKENLRELGVVELNSLGDVLEELFFSNSAGNLLPRQATGRGGSAPSQALLNELVRESDLSFSNPEDRQNILNLAYQLETFQRRALEDPTETMFSLVMSDGETREIDFSDTTMAALDIGFTTNPPVRDFDIFKRLVNEEIARRTVSEATGDVIRVFEQETDDFVEVLGGRTYYSSPRTNELYNEVVGTIGRVKKGRLSDGEFVGKVRAIVYAKKNSKEIDNLRANIKWVLEKDDPNWIKISDTNRRRLTKVSNMLDELALELNENQLIGNPSLREVGIPNASVEKIGIDFGFEHQRTARLHSLRGLLDAIRYRDELDDLDDLDPVDTDWLRAIDPETLASLGDERLGNLISIAEAGNIFDTYIRRMTGQGSRRHTNDNISSEYVTPHRALDISGFLATLSNDEIKEFNLAYDRLKGMSPRDLTGVERLNRQKMDKAFSEINVDRDIVSNSWLYDTDRYLPLTNALLEIAMPESGRNLVTRSPYGRRPAALPEYITTTLRPRSMRDMTVNDLEDAAGKLDRLLYDTELTTDPFLQPSTRERLSRQLKNLELERDRKLALAAISLGNLSTPPSEIRDTFGIDSSHYPRMKEILLDQLEAEGISDNLMQALLRLDTSDLIRNKKGVDGRRIESNKYSARTLGMLDPISGGGMGITRIEPIGPRLDMALEAWEQGDMERARNILRPMISEDIAIAINNRNNQIRGIVGDDPKESPILNLLGLNFSDDSSDDRSKEVIQKMGLAYMLEGFAMRGRQVPDLDDVETDFLDEEMIQAVYDRLEADGIDIRKPQEGGGYFLDLGVIADSAFLSPDILETNDEIWKVDRLDTITYDAPEIAEKAKKFVDDLYELEEQFHNGELDGPMAEWFRENLQGERLNLQHIMQLSNEIANLESPFDPAKARSGARLNGYEASVEVDPRVAIFNKNIKLFKDELDSELLKRSSANLRIRNSFAKSRARSRVASRAEVPDVWGEESADNARERIDATIEARVSSQAVNIWGLDLERGVVPWSMPDLQTGITPPQPSISVEPQPSTVTNDSIRTFKQNFGLSGIYLPLDKTIEADFGEGVKQYTLVTKPAVIDNGSAKLSPEGGFDFGIEGEFTHYLVPSDVLEQVNEMGAFSPEGQALLGSSAIKGSRTKGPALNWGNFSRQITRLGSGETQAYHGSFFAGKATFSPMNGEPIVVDARGSGLSRIMNNNAMLFYDELDVGQWGMGARLDGSAAWARAGVLTPDITALDSLDREMNQVADLAIAFFTKRDAGIDTTPDEKHAALITGNISRAKAIKTMANFNFGEQPIEKRPHHVDYIRALDPSGKGRNTAAFVFFSDNVFDPEKYREVIEQNPDIDIENLGTVDDPVLDLPLNLTEAAILDFGYRDLSGINPVSSVDSPVIPADRTASEVSRLLSGRQSVDEGPSTGRAFKKDVYGSIVFTGHIPTGPIGGRGALRTTGPSPDSSWDVTGAAGALTPADIPSDTPLDKIRQDYLSDFFFLNSSQDRSDDSRFYRMDLVSGNNTILFEDKETGKKYITKYRAAEAGTNSLGFDHPAFGGSENTEENGATNEALGAAVANALGFEVGAVISGGNINEIRKEVIIEPLQNIHGPDIVPLGDEFNGGLPPTPTDAQYTELLGAVDPTDVVRLLLLDGVLNNSDRNAGNLFIKRNPDGTVSLLPIDAGRGVYSNTSRAVDGKIGITFLGPTVPDESKVISIEDDGREQLKKIIVSHLMDTFNNTPTVRKMGLAKVLGKDSVRGQDTSEIKINRPELNSAVDSILSQVAQLRQTIDTNSLNDIERNFGSTESVLSTPVRDVRQAFRERLRWLQEASREDIIRLLEEAYETIQAPFEVDDNA